MARLVLKVIPEDAALVLSGALGLESAYDKADDLSKDYETVEKKAPELVAYQPGRQRLNASLANPLIRRSRRLSSAKRA
jgi:hypothetical protein